MGLVHIVHVTIIYITYLLNYEGYKWLSLQMLELHDNKIISASPKNNIHNGCNTSMQYPGGILHIVHLPKAILLVHI